MSNKLKQKLAAAQEKDSQHSQIIALSAVLILVVAAGVILLPYLSKSDGTVLQPESQAVTETCRNLNNSTGECEDREVFLSVYKTYEQDITPQLEMISLDLWDKPANQKIKAIEEKALRAFESGNYLSAQRLIEQSNEMALAVLQRAEQRFDTNLQAAIDAHAVVNYAGAKQAIDIALQVKPQDINARRYAGRIDVLPEIIPLLDQADEARVENRPRQEVDVLKKILALDPHRETLGERVAVLNQQIAEADFTLLINKAQQALEQGNITAAETSMQAIVRRFPQRDISHLSHRITELKRKRQIASLLAQAKQARNAEHWQQAQLNYGEVLKIDPTNSEAVFGVEDSGRILKGIKQVKQYLEKPLKLSSIEVADWVKQTIGKMQQLRNKSQNLNALITTVEEYLHKATIPLEIKVVSDNKTHIQVRRVGMVGKVKNKIIKLLPGEYIFEGRRNGYKSKLVNLTVNFGEHNLVARVICNERI